jgi:hypothetical protein
MRVATAGFLLAGLLMTSACSNKAASSADATATAAATDSTATAANAADADSPAPTDAPTDASGATATPASMTVHTKDGDATLGGAVDPTKLGAPIYPGAKTDPNTQGSFSASTSEGSTVVATFETNDPFDKVYDYYKAQMPAGSEGMKMSMGGVSTAEWQVGQDGAGDEVLVQVTSNKEGKVKVLITHTIKNNSSPAPSPT